MMVTRAQLEEAYAQFFGRYGGESPSDYFGAVYLQHEFDIPLERALRQVSFDGLESGLSGFHIAPDRGVLYLFLFHYGTSTQPFIQLLKGLTDNALPYIFDCQRPRVNIPSDTSAKLLVGLSSSPMRALEHLRSELQEKSKIIDKCYVHLVFDGDPYEVSRSATLTQLQDDLLNQTYRLKEYFGRRVPMFVKSVSPRLGAGVGSQPRAQYEFTVPLEELICHRGPAGEEMHIGLVSLKHLQQMHQKMGLRLFDRNIRAGLSGKTATNRSLTTELKNITIVGSVHAKEFAFHHNGVTLSVEKLETLGDQCRLVEPRVLNGAQTISTVTTFLNNKRFAPQIDRKKFAAIQVLCRIITNAGPEFVTQVTINNNRQNPVRPSQLRAHDEIQLLLQDWFRQKAGIYYERQHGASRALTDELRVDLGILSGKHLELEKLAKTFLALNGSVWKMRSLNAVFEDQDEYDKLFHPRRLKANVRDLVVCYKMQLRIRLLLDEILARGEKKYAYIFKARNLVWALLCQAYLNDKRRPQMAEEHGEDLVATGRFTDDMAQLVSQKVRPILGETLSVEEYRVQLEEERYDVLSTAAVWRDCMRVGERRFGWKKRNLP